MSRIRTALQHAELELKQMHSHYKPECKTGCPTLKYIEECQEALDELRSIEALLKQYVPQPRICNYMNMATTANWIGSTWLEPEEFSYPNAAMNRRAFVICDSEEFAVVMYGIPDTAFSIPAYRIVKGKRVKGYVSSDEYGYKFTTYKGERSK